VATETKDLEIKLKMDQVTEQLRKVDGLTQKQIDGIEKNARRAFNAIERNARTQEREVKRAAAAVSKELQGAQKEIEKFGKKVTSGLTSTIQDYTKGLSATATALGPVGVAATGAGLALTAYGAAAQAAAAKVVELVRGAAESIAKFRELNQIEALGLTAAAVEIHKANAALDALGLASEAVSVQLAGQLAPSVEYVASVLARGALAVSDYIGRISKWREENEWLANTITQVATEFADRYIPGWYLARKALEVVDEQTQEYQAQLEGLTSSLEKQAVAQVKATKSIDQHAAAMKRAMALVDSMQEAMADPQGKIEIAYQKRIAAIKELEAVLGNTLVTSLARDLAEQERAEALLKIDMERMAQIEKMEAKATQVHQSLAISLAPYVTTVETLPQKLQRITEEWDKLGTTIGRSISHSMKAINTFSEAIDSIAALMTQTHQNRLDEITSEREAITKQYQQMRADFVASKDQMDDRERESALVFLGQQRQIDNAKRKQLKQEEQRHKAALLKAFQMQKAAAIIDIIIKGAQAAASALTLGPIAGPIAMGATAAMVAAQVALVASQKPPKFHRGGMAPDETPATLRKGEAVLNQRATTELGPETISALNQGRQALGQIQTVELGPRTLAALRPAMASAAPSGRISDGGYGRRR